MKSIALSVIALSLCVGASFAGSNATEQVRDVPPTSFVKVFEKPAQVVTNIVDATGKAYSNAIIVSVEPDGLTLKLKSGVRKMYFTELTKDVQGEYGYTPEKAKQYQEDCARARADSYRLQAEKAEARRLAQEKYEKEQEEEKARKRVEESDARAKAETRRYEANLAAQQAESRLKREQSRQRARMRENAAELGNPGTHGSSGIGTFNQHGGY